MINQVQIYNDKNIYNIHMKTKFFKIIIIEFSKIVGKFFVYYT